MDPVAWQNMLEQGTAFQFLENLRKTNPEVYEDYKRRVGAGGQR
jgi:hypothetical protein